VLKFVLESTLDRKNMLIFKPYGVRLLVLMSALTLAACQTGEPAVSTTVTNQPEDAKWQLPITPQTWRAVSRTATGVTGDITVTRDQIVFQNGASIQIKAIDQSLDTGTTLYQVMSKTNPELLNGNLLCGQDPVNYLTLEQLGPKRAFDLSMTVYYYPEELRLKDLPLRDKTDLSRTLCAIYNYIS
jgi:hypothetical protein